MTDQELQTAIDSARKFMDTPSTQGGILHQAREHTKTMLKELEKAQVLRALAVTEPTLTKVD